MRDDAKPAQPSQCLVLEKRRRSAIRPARPGKRRGKHRRGDDGGDNRHCQTDPEPRPGAAGAPFRDRSGNPRFDLLVTDVGLPGGMNGRQLAKVGHQRHPDLKVLFITCFAETVAAGKGTLEPGFQVITKPFTMDALAAKIREMIDA